MTVLLSNPHAGNGSHGARGLTAAVSAVVVLAFLNAPAASAALAAAAPPKPVLTCKMEVNQYYPDNNGAFENVLLNTGDGTVTDGNGVNKAVFSADDTKYQFKYQFEKKDYTYIVFRTTGVMNLIHKFPVDKMFVNGTNYKCEIYQAKPKF
jgi:hypothetical protein